MRIVLLNQFYPPDVAPTGLYLHDLGRALVRAGHSVTVVCSRHAYGGGGRFPERDLIDGVEVRRLSGLGFGRGTYAGKLADYSAYYARLAATLTRSLEPELVISLTTPPFLGLLAKALAAFKRVRHAHWVMDVYPDVMQAHGFPEGLALKALRALTRGMYGGAHSIATLGPAMAARLRRYAPAATPVAWVPLWAPDGLAPWPSGSLPGLRVERGWDPARLVLLYSGNFGLGHRFGEFLAAAERLGPGGPIWAFAGAGRGRPVLEGFARDRPELPIELRPYAAEAQLQAHLCSADVHLVSMDHAWEGTLLPSKLQASFAVGKPVIFVGRNDLDIARWVEESGAGWVVGEGDVAGLLAALEAASDAGERARRGASARAFAEDRFDRARNLEALIGALLRA